ncbi:glutamate synthase large subunit [Epilithonimonas hispanica]|uniref:Glutamate synthase [NADPH] large chain n=1 Tax=Epilithonimonas hispanica TaxID=358687 RepID=A0A3D9CXY7_9FLAO|nr:glutamate synthase large subunit [Epilithonimonas hispanica]REC70640.1 glutamate synthase large subunit [Epilithonimonas hispanica]
MKRARKISQKSIPKNQGLYLPETEFDSCGVGFVANIKGIKSFKIVSDAITMLENMEHRGATGYESNTGDGAGLQIQIPHELLYDEALNFGFDLPDPNFYGVGMLFFPQNNFIREECKEIIAQSADKLGLKILGYRPVPVNNIDLGDLAKSVEPVMEMLFVERPFDVETDKDFERKLFVFRNYISHQITSVTSNDPIGFYVASFSCKKLIYKGQLRSVQIRNYFKDLTNPKTRSAFGMIHSRFATNTSPTWSLAQPFRFLAHNGEINTIGGNLNWLKSSEKTFSNPNFTPQEMDMILPLTKPNQSDSSYLDNMVELLYHSGRSLPHTMMMLIPEAWDGNKQMEDYKKDFYEFHACMMEPWDGPASISFTDGEMIGATLDRNGLRPSRYCVTSDDLVIMASESGALPVNPKNVIKRGRLQPGKMFLVDMKKGVIVSDDELKKEICTSKPYRDWLDKMNINLKELPSPKIRFNKLQSEDIFKYQKAFGYSREDLDKVIKEMAVHGKEPIGAMGFDAPLAVLSEKPQHFSSYFKQLFAQVTNPPIDPIREKLVMSLTTIIGGNGNLLEDDKNFAHSIKLEHPILNNEQLEKLRSVDTGKFQSKTIYTYFKADEKEGSLKKALDRICRYAIDAVEDGFEVIILSDRSLDSQHASIPSLLACSAVHHHLIRKGVRRRVGLVIEAGDVWEVHHFASLLGFGATAINPYLALASIRQMFYDGEFKQDADLEQLKSNYKKAVGDGLLKIFSKMGISTLQSYHGAQIFEIIGLNKPLVNTCFTGAISRINGIGFDEIAKEALAKHYQAFKNDSAFGILDSGGIYQWRKDSEYHQFNPQSIHLLQQATWNDNYETFKKYSRAVNRQTENASLLRGLLEFKNDRQSIPLSEVEPIENILKRFATGAMSFGSISWEAHTTLAIAMNRIGAKSNTGEGGEDENRYVINENGDSLRSSIKQVASGRFGVTARYLAEAEELQIKMAQGAKPGEGGQLSGEKVDSWIGKTRHSTPGVGLISPPPHHDIYSIEDLAQLIFDLKNANRHARISVKLVSKAGVGTIASGVAKAKADHILISGYDGGTGASPLSSVRHTGLPWELGLAETHQTLIKNKLRQRVTVQVDGQMKTGRDLVMATLLGAEEWGIATSALIVEGCILMRKCHLNTCPVGIATQNEELRKKFTGKPEHLVSYFTFLAMEVREIMASLGFRTIDEMVGQSQCLEKKKEIKFWKHQNIDLSGLLFKMETDLPIVKAEEQDSGLDESLSWEMLEVSQSALENNEKVEASFLIKNTDRTVGTILSHELTKIYHSDGMQEDALKFNFKGTAGQSFGAFCNQGITMILEGDANDYFGKGLSGAKLAVFPDEEAVIKANENSIIGNVALYGATSGKVFINGMAGERFCVRNSGAIAVVEGIGDHGCEYMTGGTVVILGGVGRNFGAGMSGGIAYVWDVRKDLEKNFNPDMADLEQLTDRDKNLVFALIQEHFEMTKSLLAEYLLSDFENNLKHFVKVYPREYKKVMENQINVMK